MNLRQLLLILRLRWPLVLIATILATAGATFYTLRLPKMYTSQTSLLLDVKADPLVATFMPSITAPAFFATQQHIIKSDKVAAAVVKRLGLESNPDAVRRWKMDTGGKVPLPKYYASVMQRGLQVEPAPGTNVLNLSFTAVDPQFAATVANVYAQAYIDFSVDLRVEPARQYATWFDGQLKVLKGELEAAQTALSAAERNSGIISSDARLDEEVNKLGALSQQLASMQVQRADDSVMARNSGRETSPDAMRNGPVQELRGKVSKLEADFEEARSRYGSSHPVYQSLQSQVEVAKQQLNAELRKVSVASNTQTQVSAQKLAEFAALVETQKRKVMSMRGGRDDIAILVKDVETAQRAYEAVANRRSQLTLESQSETAAARVLSVAVEALTPTSKAPLHILMGLLGGLGLGCAFALGLEFMDRRIRSTEDLLAIEGVPVLAVMGSNHTWSLPRPSFQSLLPGSAGKSTRLLSRRETP